MERDEGKRFDPAVVRAMMVAYRKGSLIALKPLPAKQAESEIEEAEDAVVAEAATNGEESLRKAMGTLSRLNTIRMTKDGEPEKAK